MLIPNRNIVYKNFALINFLFNNISKKYVNLDINLPSINKNYDFLLSSLIDILK